MIELQSEERQFWEAVFLVGYKMSPNLAVAADAADKAVQFRRERIADKPASAAPRYSHKRPPF